VLAALKDLSRRERVAFTRNLLRFPMLGAILLFESVPRLGAHARTLGPMVTAGAGPWAGVIGAAGCFAAVLAYAVVPLLRRRPLVTTLGDVHFYVAALAVMGLLVGLFQAGSDSILIRDPEGLRRIAGFVRIRVVSGWILCATALLPAIAWLSARARRTPSPTTDGAASS